VVKCIHYIDSQHPNGSPTPHTQAQTPATSFAEHVFTSLCEGCSWSTICNLPYERSKLLCHVRKPVDGIVLAEICMIDGVGHIICWLPTRFTCNAFMYTANSRTIPTDKLTAYGRRNTHKFVSLVSNCPPPSTKHPLILRLQDPSL